MSSHHELIVLYGASGNHLGDVEEIQTHLDQYPISNAKFLPILPNRIARFFNWFNRNGIFKYSFYLAFRIWHLRVQQKVVELINSEEISIVHYLTPIGFREPGYLWKLPIPYIWGPIGGTYCPPLKLAWSKSPKVWMHFFFRAIVNQVQLHMSCRISQALKKSRLVIAATKYDQFILSKISGRKISYLPENGILALNFDSMPEYYDASKDGLNVIWVGRIDRNKSLETLIKAISLISSLPIKLKVVGDGLLKKKAINLTRAMGLGNHIEFLGQVQREEVLAHFKRSDVHVITSLSEGNPTVIWEAMSCGIPTISLNHCGMKDVICDHCGIKIELRLEEEMVQDLAIHLKELFEDSNKLLALKLGARKCAQSYLYDHHVAWWNNTYSTIIAQSK